MYHYFPCISEVIHLYQVHIKSLKQDSLHLNHPRVYPIQITENPKTFLPQRVYSVQCLCF